MLTMVSLIKSKGRTRRKEYLKIKEDISNMKEQSIVEYNKTWKITEVLSHTLARAILLTLGTGMSRNLVMIN